MPTRTSGEAEPARPPSATGRATWDSWSTSMSAGREHQVAAAMMASDSSPPSGKPMKTLALLTSRSCCVQCSSTAPEEKKNTSYGVIAAPNRAMA